MSRNQQTMNGMYAINGPYLLSPDWSAAVYRLTLATPPLVSYFLLFSCKRIISYKSGFLSSGNEMIKPRLLVAEEHFDYVL